MKKPKRPEKDNGVWIRMCGKGLYFNKKVTTMQAAAAICEIYRITAVRRAAKEAR